MNRVPTISSLECVAALRRAGFAITKQTSTTLILERLGRVVLVPRHRILSEGAMNLVLRSAAIPLDHFLALLEPPRRISGEIGVHADGEGEESEDTG